MDEVQGAREATADPEVVRRLLVDTDVWAIVGLGNNPSRAAYSVARFLQSHGKRIVPVHPSGAPVHGETGYRELADIPFAVDVVDVFRRSSEAGAVADEAVTINARGVWFQLGVIDLTAFQRTTAAGLDMVMDRCPVIEWRPHGDRSDPSQHVRG